MNRIDRSVAVHEAYAAAVAFVDVEKTSGDRGIGSAFHVGDGVFVTARHVVESNTIVGVGCVTATFISPAEQFAGADTSPADVGKWPMRLAENGTLELEGDPFLHPNPDVDVAVFKVGNLDPATPYIPLGTRLDNWIGPHDFVLQDVVILGHPPVPMTVDPYLIAARAEVNSTIRRHDADYIHFIVSATPRGGFSGGPVITAQSHDPSENFVLGLVTSDLTRNLKHELGFMTVLSVEPIYGCLRAAGLMPKVQEIIEFPED